MSNIKSIFRGNLENYDIEYCNFVRQFREQGEDTNIRFRYAEDLQKPIKENCVLFWCKGGAYTDVPRYIFEYLYRTYGQKLQYLWVVKTKKKRPADLPENVIVVEKNSEAYAEALATAKYLVGNAAAPFFFIKRKEQIYANSLQGEERLLFPGDKYGTDAKSRLMSEMLKTDILFSGSPAMEEELYGKQYQLTGLYQGKIIGCGGFWAETADEKDYAAVEGSIAEAAEQILAYGREKHNQKDSTDRKKRLLVVTNWNAKREERYLTKAIIGRIGRERYDVTAMARKTNDVYLNYEFGHLPGTVRGLLYRGPLTLKRDEMVHLKIVRKYPRLYVEIPEIREYIDMLMRREWERVAGEVSFDCIIMSGRITWQECFWVNAQKNCKKILIADQFFTDLKEEAPRLWQRMLMEYEHVYVPAYCKDLCDFGAIDAEKLSRLPVVWADNEEGRAEQEHFSLDGREYFVADRWTSERGSEKMRLIQVPPIGCSIMSAEVVLDDMRREYIKEKISAGGFLYFVGEKAQSYKEFAGDRGEVLDDFVLKYLPMLSTAVLFFDKVEEYVRGSEIQNDVMDAICSVYHISVKKLPHVE